MNNSMNAINALCARINWPNHAKNKYDIICSTQVNNAKKVTCCKTICWKSITTFKPILVWVHSGVFCWVNSTNGRNPSRHLLPRRSPCAREPPPPVNFNEDQRHWSHIISTLCAWPLTPPLSRRWPTHPIRPLVHSTTVLHPSVNTVY